MIRLKVIAARAVVAGLFVLIVFFALLVFWPVLLPLASLLALAKAFGRIRLQGTWSGGSELKFYAALS